MSRKVRGPKVRVSGFPVLEPLCNAFATICGTRSRNAYRHDIEVQVYGYETIRHGAYIGGLAAPSAIFTFAFPQTGGTGLVRAHPSLLSRILDLSLGGDGRLAGGTYDRELTPIDIAIYGRFVDLVVQSFTDAIVELCGQSRIGTARRNRFEEQPGTVRIAPDRTGVLTIKLNFRFGAEEEPAGLDLVVPVPTIEPLRADLAKTSPASEEVLAAWERSMREQVMGLDLEADCVIDLGMFSVGELSRLEQGSMIELPPGAMSNVEMRVPTAGGEVAFARGRLGANGRHKAIRLVDDPDRDFLAPLLLLADRAGG